MKKLYLLLVLSVLILAACKNDDHEFKTSLINHEGVEVKFPQDKPAVIFSFDTYSNINSQTQLIALHKKIKELRDIDANIYVISRDASEDHKRFQKGIKKMTGESVEFLSDPYFKFGEVAGLKNKDTLYEGYAILSTSGKVVLSVKNDKFGEEIADIANKIEKQYKSEDVIKLAKEEKKEEIKDVDNEKINKDRANTNNIDTPTEDDDLNKEQEKPLNEDSNSETTEPTKQVEKVFHPVVSGDSLSKIANEYKVPIDVIKQNNNVEYNTIFIGQELFIYETVNIQGNVTIKINHRVIEGETLEDIASKYSITKELILKDNNISYSSIYPGQEILINIPKGL